MSSLAKINIKFFADIAQFSSGIQNANRKVTNLGKNFTKVGKNLSLGLTAPIVAYGGASLIAFNKQAQGLAQVEAGLRSTGRFSKQLFTQLQKDASNLQNNSLFGDEEILQGSTAQILSFTKISTDKIARVNQVVADLSARLRVDLKSSSIQVGKALNDPVANLSALSRSGIQFSEDQRKVINALVKTNQLAKAQDIILGELENQYGGSAKAAAEAGTGWMKQLGNSIGDLSEDFGKIINDFLKPFGEKIKGLVTSFKGLDDGTKKIIVVIAAFAAAVGPLLIVLGFMMTTVIPGLTTAFAGLSAVIIANPIGALITVVGLAAAGFYAFSGSASKAASEQEVLNKVTDLASKSIAKQKGELASLLAIARSESATKTQRLEAIKAINALSDEYLGNITLETINTEAARKAIDAYNVSLLESAKVKAAQKLLQDNQEKQLAAEIKYAAIQKKLALEYAQQWKDKEEGVVRVGAVNEEVIKTELANAKKLLDAGKLEEQQLLKIITAQKIKQSVVANDPINTPRSKVTPIGNNLKVGGIIPLGQVQDDAITLDTTLTGVSDRVIDFTAQLSSTLTEGANTVIAGFGAMIGGLMSGSLTMGDVAGMLLTTIGNLAVELGKAAIKIGVGMLAIKAAFTNPFTAIAAGVALVAVGTLIGGLGQKFSGNADAGAFANGGIVGGNSTFGDKLFARVNSGEMILNQSQQANLNRMLQPAASALGINLSGEFKVKGTDLVLVYDREINRQKRTR